MKISAFILLILPLFALAQGLEKDLTESIKEIKSIPTICRSDINKLYFSDQVKNKTSNSLPKPTGCGDKAFWSIVRLKDKAIPFLIEKLDDTTTTSVAVPQKSYNYKVADISYLILKEIVPELALSNSKKYSLDTLRRNYRERISFKQQISNWYRVNKANLVWAKSDSFSNCDCQGPHPNGGHYIVKK